MSEAVRESYFREREMNKFPSLVTGLQTQDLFLSGISSFGIQTHGRSWKHWQVTTLSI